MRLEFLGSALVYSWLACGGQIPTCQLIAAPVQESDRFPAAARNASPSPNGAQSPASGSPQQPSEASAGKPPTIDLQEALRRARLYNPAFQSATVAAGLAREDRVQAKAALLPTLSYLNQYIYTQGNGTPSGVFVANDGVHIYNSQAVVHEELFSLTRRAEYRRTIAAEVVAQAKRDIAARGLIVTVVQGYYGLVIAGRHLTNARRSVDEAQRFLEITQKQERGGEVAHADVIKAQLQLQQRRRDVVDAEVTTEKTKVALGVLLFADPTEDFNVVDDLQATGLLASLEEIRRQVLANNPEIRAAEAGVQQTQLGVSAARGAALPAAGGPGATP